MVDSEPLDREEDKNQSTVYNKLVGAKNGTTIRNSQQIAWTYQDSLK